MDDDPLENTNEMKIKHTKRETHALNGISQIIRKTSTAVSPFMVVFHSST